MLQGYSRQGELRATRETSCKHTSAENAAGAAGIQSSSEANAMVAQTLKDNESQCPSLQALEQAHRMRGANLTRLLRRQQSRGPVMANASRCLAQRNTQYLDERRSGFGLGMKQLEVRGRRACSRTTRQRLNQALRVSRQRFKMPDHRVMTSQAAG